MTVPTQDRVLTVTETAPTQQDAQLLVQLGSLAAAMSTDSGQALLLRHRESGGLSMEEFKATYPPGSDGHNAIFALMKWHETVGTLVKQNLLNRALVLDWLWVAGIWNLCKAIAYGQRAETGVPQLWENFEALAASQKE